MSKRPNIFFQIVQKYFKQYSHLSHFSKKEEEREVIGLFFIFLMSKHFNHLELTPSHVLTLQQSSTLHSFVHKHEICVMYMSGNFFKRIK